MFQKTLITLSAVALLLLAGSAAWSASQIYRWVDDQGVVHFGSIVPEGVEATPVGVRPNTVPSVSAPSVKPSENAEPASEDGAASDAQAAEDESVSYAEQRRRARAEKAREQAQQAEKRAKECDLMRRQLAVLEPSPRVMIRGEDGTVQRLDDDKRLEALDETKAFLAANCNN
ncbi:MAG: DUF4124 domain-containing protein [Xanthomonadales bacterium]|nr:DUF4124 domain-containing protein [Gammaproteobacteria bacterium]NNE06500.1 DUF4124 domain-containing protein [Xanthomonadales bacterium]NNL96468.1 DUF4124 domain-containing protein [Xanthomonadales bacterium]